MDTCRVAALLVIVGLAALAHPLYLFAHHGQTSAFVHQIDAVEGEPITDDAVAYAELPPQAQRAIDAALNGESHALWRPPSRRSRTPSTSGAAAPTTGTTSRIAAGS
jgi:hypothetical protein